MIMTRSVVYVASQELVKISSLLPSNTNRSTLVHSLISSFGLLSAVGSSDEGESKLKPSLRVVRPRSASALELCVYHDAEYIEFILSATQSRDQEHCPRFGLEDDCPPFEGMDKYVQLVAGATLTAAEALKTTEADVSICWDGGRHHAQKAKAAGFCYVADCTLAILALKKAPPVVHLEPPRKKARIISSSHTIAPQILTLSVHHAAPGFYPAIPLSSLPDPDSDGFDPFTLSLPLKRGASARTFERVWAIVEAVKDVFCPDYVIIQCGADGLAGDPHGIWNWGVGGGRGDMDWCIGEAVRKWSAKLLLLGGGGYNSPNTARAWACITAIAKGRELPADSPIPDHAAFPLYAPSFTVEVPAGNMRDENTDDYLREVEKVYNSIILQLRDECGNEQCSTASNISDAR